MSRERETEICKETERCKRSEWRNNRAESPASEQRAASRRSYLQDCDGDDGDRGAGDAGTEFSGQELLIFGRAMWPWAGL